MKAHVRKLLLIGAVAAVVAIVAFQPARDDGAKTAPREAAATGSVARGNAAPALQVPERRSLGEARGELFGAPPPPP